MKCLVVVEHDVVETYDRMRLLRKGERNEHVTCRALKTPLQHLNALTIAIHAMGRSGSAMIKVRR